MHRINEDFIRYPGYPKRYFSKEEIKSGLYCQNMIFLKKEKNAFGSMDEKLNHKIVK